MLGTSPARTFSAWLAFQRFFDNIVIVLCPHRIQSGTLDSRHFMEIEGAIQQGYEKHCLTVAAI